MKRHAADRPVEGDLVYTATQDVCPHCGRVLAVYQNDARRVQGLDAMFWMRRRDKRCRPDCPGPRPIWYATRDLRVVLPQRIYGLDVTLTVGERHLLDGVPLGRITADLNARGVPIDQRHTGRVFRDFVALTQLARGTDEAVKARLRAQGGVVLMCDGVQFDDRSPVLYLVWDAISGEPLFGARKRYRGMDDLVPLLEHARDMGVPIVGVVTDKEKGLVPAVKEVFPDVPYQFCHTHFLKNCAKPLQEDLAKLQASVQRRAEAVHTVSKLIAHDDDEPHVPPSAPMSEADLVREVCDLARANSRVSGKAPLDPAELKRHERLVALHAFIGEAKMKPGPDGRPGTWPLLDRLEQALAPTWHETRVAGRVGRHTDILRSVAHELSNDPDREDRPESAVEAQARFEACLAELAADTPRTGLAAPTGAFIDSILERYERYREHLFVCFDDGRIPATTNSLEGFFGRTKSTLRRAGGAGSTTNTVVANLGAEVLVAYQFVRRPGALAAIRSPDATATAFAVASRGVRSAEAPGIHRRSLIRRFDHQIEKLRDGWSFTGA